MSTDTLIGFALDRSGSMGSVLPATVEGFNTFLKEQQDAPGKAKFSLVLFDTQFEARFVAEKIGNVPPLQAEGNAYSTGGMTALFDAVGSLIQGLEAKVAKMKGNPQVMCVILTDGQENSSNIWTVGDGTGSTENDLAHLIKQKQEQGWSFIFLGSGGSSWLERTFGHVVDKGQFHGYDHSLVGNSVAYAAVNTAVTRSRSKGVTATITSDDLAAAEALVSADRT